MSTQTRRLLLITSLVLVACGLLSLAYALWPLNPNQVIATLSPTLFAPPYVGVP
jgi:hypothetical protein